MPLWNHEYTVDSNAQESMKYWHILVNRMDDTLIRRIRLNMFMMLIHVIIGAVISSGVMCKVGNEHGIVHMHLLASTIGVVMCMIWRLFGVYYREILAARASVVYELEQTMFMRAYTCETEEIVRAGKLANSAIGLIEGVMPLIVMVLYLVWTVCEAYVYIR